MGVVDRVRATVLRIRRVGQGGTTVPSRDNAAMRISAKADYAVRAAVELASSTTEGPMTTEQLATSQGMPRKFLESILADLRRAGLVQSLRGSSGGYRMALPADQVTVADVVRAVDGPLVWVRDARPSELDYSGTAEPLAELWVALRASVRSVLGAVTLADLAAGRLPTTVTDLAADPQAWDNP